jgi:PAS domain S-box-containing protein
MPITNRSRTETVANFLIHDADDQKFRQFLRQAPGIFMSLSGPAMIIEYANESLLSYSGKDWSIIGKPLLQAIPELADQRFPQLLDEVFATGKAYFGKEEKAMISRNGSLYETWYDFVYQPVRGHDGTVTGITVMASDITEQVLARKKIEEAQQESERQKRLYEAITGSTPDLIYVFDLNYRFIYANPALLSMWGTSWEDAIGKSLLEIGYEPWHAERHERELDRLVATKQPVRGEASFPHATLGRRVYDYIFVPVFNANGEVEAVAGTTRDITELKRAEEAAKQSEEQFRSLTEALPQLIWTANTDGYCDFFNRQWYDYTGSTPDESCGDGWLQYIHPAHRDELFHKWQHSLRTGGPIVAEFELRASDGVYQWFYVLGKPISDNNGMIVRWVGALTNIEGQKAVEGRLEHLVMERTRELHRSNEDLQQFAHVASHDLKEPVRKVRLFTGRILQEWGNELPEKAKEYLSKIESAAERMHSMIEGVLSYSSFNATEQSWEEINLNEVMRSVQIDLEVVIAQKQATIQYSTLPTINGSQVLIYQLLYNLINNSLKFSKAGVPPVIAVESSIVNINQPDEYVKITLSDNGIGFNQSDAEKIFQTFSRLHPKDRYEGTGLGLALCKHIMEKSGGHIYAEGKTGEGATITMLFPVKRPH